MKTPSGTATWSEWFAKHWGETLDVYFARAKIENLAQRIVEYEQTVYGESLAEQRAEVTRELMRADRAKLLKKSK